MCDEYVCEFMIMCSINPVSCYFSIKLLIQEGESNEIEEVHMDYVLFSLVSSASLRRSQEAPLPDNM